MGRPEVNSGSIYATVLTRVRHVPLPLTHTGVGRPALNEKLLALWRDAALNCLLHSEGAVLEMLPFWFLQLTTFGSS
jgi:hypothetical protein